MESVTKNLASRRAIKCNGSVHDLYKIKAIDENWEQRISNSHLDLREVARAYASTMRSVISFQPNESSLRGLRKFKLLRVLDVVDTDAYLAFGCPMEVPSALSRLRYLQYLIICPSKRSKKYKYSTDEVYLPLEIWMLPLLTHLVSFFDLFPDLFFFCSAHTVCGEEADMYRRDDEPDLECEKAVNQQDYQLHNLVLLSRLVKKGFLLQRKS